MQYTTRAKREGRVRRRQTLTSPGGPDTADSVFLTDKVHITTTLRPVGGGGGGGGGTETFVDGVLTNVIYTYCSTRTSPSSLLAAPLKLRIRIRIFEKIRIRKNIDNEWSKSP